MNYADYLKKAGVKNERVDLGWYKVAKRLRKKVPAVVGFNEVQIVRDKSLPVSVRQYKK